MHGVVIVLTRPQRVHFTVLEKLITSQVFNFKCHHCCLTGVSCYSLQDILVLQLTIVIMHHSKQNVIDSSSYFFLCTFQAASVIFEGDL